MGSLPSSIVSSGALLEMKLLRAHADLRTQTPVGPGRLLAGPQVIPMAFNVENFSVDVTVGAVMAKKDRHTLWGVLERQPLEKWRCLRRVLKELTGL